MVCMKKLLVLGGTVASLDVVKTARKMGVYTIVTDDRPTGVSKEIADETAMVSTSDMDGLLALIKAKKIDGVFCGPSEFNIANVMRICALAKLPFYATKEQWDICSDKSRFKQLCRENDVPCVPEFQLGPDFSQEDLEKIEYPVIVKPVDGCSSKGITVCYTEKELKEAYNKALTFSQSGNIIVERYIQNGGIGVAVRYIINNGDFYFSLAGDNYVVDPIKRTAFISALAAYPSKFTADYTNNINEKVISMFKRIGIKNGVLFMQALPENGNIYFHEMGFRISGGLTFKITEPTCGINDLEMMIRFALGGEMCTADEIQRIDPFINGKTAGCLCIPLKTGTIAAVEGLDEILREYNDTDFIQYYYPGDSITQNNIGTLMQHFGRFNIFTENITGLSEKIDTIQRTLKITDTQGKDMMYMPFDLKRLD